MKKWMALLLTLAILLSMAACGGKTVEPAPSTEVPEVNKSNETANEAQPEQEPIVVEAYIVTADWSDAWDIMEERFEKEYPWIDLQSVGMGETGTSWVATRLAANDLPDVTMIDNVEFWQNLIDQGGVVADLSGRDVCQNIPQSYLDAFTYNETLMGITQGAAYSVMYYNMQMLNEAGWEDVPANWDELLACCEDLQSIGYAPIVLSSTLFTTNWMPIELIIANTLGDELGQGVYEEQLKNGTFDFSASPELAERWEMLIPYIMTGSAGMSQEDALTALSDGSVAMYLDGNWIANAALDGIATAAGDVSMARAGLPPFQDEGEACWVSVSPETAFAMTIDESRSASEQEAVELFFDWLFLPENFMLIQNARGTIPVLSSMKEEHIVLPDEIITILSDLNSAPYVTMGFNLVTTTFSDTINSALCETLSGYKTAQEVFAQMWEVEQTSFFNQ